MPKVSKKEVENRPKEIRDATRRLYEKISFHEISFKEISEEAHLSRPSIYNYFENKEEIFLSILEEEYALWANDLNKIIEDHDSLSKNDFSSLAAETLQKRETLLKIQCMNLYEIEEHSREDLLFTFKIEYGKAISMVNSALIKFFPHISEIDRDRFIISFFAFMYGIFPYAHPTLKQIKAMERAGMKIRETSIKDATKECVLSLLSKY